MHVRSSDAGLVRPIGRVGGILYVLSGFLSVGLIWSYLTEIDLVIRATGIVRPEGEVVRVTATIEGTVGMVYVAEGDELRRGDAIVRLDDRESRTERWMLETQIELLQAQLRILSLRLDDSLGVHKAEVLKLEAEIDGARLDLDRRRTEHAASQRSAAIQLRRAHDDFEITQELMEAGVISLQTRDRAWTDLLLAETRYADLAARTPSDSALEELRRARNVIDAHFKLRQREIVAEAAPIEAQLAGLHSELDRVEVKQARHTIRSPVDGRLTLFPDLHPGEAVAASTLVAAIAPRSASVVVEVLVSNRDAEDVRPSQPVRLILKDSSAVHGLVRSVGPDARFNDAASGAHRVVITPETDNLLLGSGLDVRFIVGRERLLLLLVTRARRSLRNWTGTGPSGG